MFAALSATIVCSAKPNIVVALTDDLGWNYPGYHGTPSDAITPTLDQLAVQEAVRLGALSTVRRDHCAFLCSLRRGAAFIVSTASKRVFMCTNTVHPHARA